mgnify:CR=1 FL=1|jgi:hypothetical protein
MLSHIMLVSNYIHLNIKHLINFLGFIHIECVICLPKKQIL